MINLVAFDETHCWAREDSRIAKLGRCFGVYLYDDSVATHCCEFTPSYDLHFLQNEFENTFESAGFDDEEATEMEYLSGDHDIIYVHCNAVDAAKMKQSHPEWKLSDFDSRDDMIADALEYFQGSCPQLTSGLALAND